MVITIHKLLVGSFTSLQCLSGTELLNLSRAPYITLGIFAADRDTQYEQPHSIQEPGN
jgi:hypothetical protein